MFPDIKGLTEMQRRGKGPYTLPNPKQTVPESGERDLSKQMQLGHSLFPETLLSDSLSPDM